MQCARYQKWIYLYRENELTQHQQRKLHRHLHRCEGCESLLQKVLSIQSQIDEIRRIEPELSEPEEMTHQVMMSIPFVDRKNLKKRRWESCFDLGIFKGMRIQAVTAVVAIFLVLGFVVQEALVINMISQLERQIRTDAEIRRQNTAVPFHSSNLKNLINRPEFIKKLEQLDKSYMSVSEDWILINRRQLSKLLAFYRKWILQGKIDGEILNTDFSELLDYLEEKDINVKQILQNRETIVKYIKMM